MRWPWKGKPETRSAEPFGDAVLAALVAQATGTSGADPAATATLEGAGGLLGRVLASARVEGPTDVRMALTGDLLQMVGRELVRRGSSLLVIDVRRDGVMLTPAATWDVRGDFDPATWQFRVDRIGPSNTDSRVVSYDRVALFRWATDPWRPWAGVSPLGAARLTARVLAEVEHALGDESAGPRGSLIPTPPFNPAAATEDAPDPTAALRTTIASLKGRAAVVEAGTWGGDQADRPREDYRPRRLGADPPDALTMLRSDTAAAVLSACGVPPALVDPRSDGTLARESLRRYFATTVQPIAMKISAELTMKLDAEVRLRFDDAAFQDSIGRANVVAKLAEHIGAAAALEIAGLGRWAVSRAAVRILDCRT